MKKKILHFFKITFALVIIFYLYRTNKISLQFFIDFLNFKQLCFCITFFIIFYLVSVFRWFYILKKIDKSIKFSECFKYDSSSIIFNFLLPIGEISGEIYRGYLLHKEKNIDMKRVITSLVIDRGSGAFSLIFMSIFFLPVLFYIKYSSELFFSLYLFIILFFFNLKKFFRFLIKVFPKLANYDLELLKKVFLPCFFISVISFCLYFISMMFLYNDALSNYNILYKSILIFPLGLLINAIPISPGGLGVGSLGFIFLSNLFFLENYIFLENSILALQFFFLLFGLLSFFISCFLNNSKKSN